jgi:hypothetical protein
MLRRLFATLVALLLSSGSPSPADEIGASDVEQMKRRRQVVPAVPAVSGSTARGTLLARADEAGPPLLGSARQSHVGFLSLARMARSTDAVEPMVAQALARCRDRGDLKVVVILGDQDPETVRQTCEQHGFTFSKFGRFEEAPTVELYTDLYRGLTARQHAGLGRDLCASPLAC